ncbi:hypothetical protein BX666DRAFT_2026303 [Dichotomocladium elegans]|nr:hypothetical protein BX666DRAFT_2026303 [Dichotomocladium elegans]
MTFLSQFESVEEARISFERKLKVLVKQTSHLTQRSIRGINSEKIDWEHRYKDARTRREYYLMHLRGCKQVVAAYNRHWVLRADNGSMCPEQKRPGLTEDELAGVLHNVNNTKLPTVRFP